MTRPPSLSAHVFTLLLGLTLALPAWAQQTPATQPQAGAEAQSQTNWPVAVRWWGQGFVTIETWWGLTVAIDPYDPAIGYDDPEVSADLVLITHAHRDHNNPDLVQGEPNVIRGLGEGGMVRELRVALDRHPNEEQPRAGELAEMDELSSHAVTAFTVPSFHDDQEGAERGRNAMWLVEADGVRILHMGDFGQSELSGEQIAHIGRVDVMLIPVGGTYTIDGETAARIVEQVHPRIVVPMHYKTEPLEIDLANADAFIEALPESYERVEAVGNTVAASAFLSGRRPQKVVTLDYQPWEMPEELAGRFEELTQALQQSAELYAPLSVNQMNFRPSNGTHTPRWNVEHTNAYALSMFSGFFSIMDPEVRRFTGGPAQMPADYQPANSEWTGAEEARQIERTVDYARRFAYLLAPLDMDDRVEGVRIPLGGVFDIQTRHYNEHTANVEEKFNLPDWPAE